MSEKTASKQAAGSAKFWVGGTAAGLATGVLIWAVALGPLRRPETAEVPPAQPETTAADATTTDTAAPATTEAASSATAPEAAAPAVAQVAPPAFDTVRADPDGTILVAGSAPAGANVALAVEGAQVFSGPADSSGKFAAFFTLPFSDLPRVLTLSATPQGGATVAAAAEVILAPIPAPAAEATAAATDEAMAAATDEAAATATTEVEPAAATPEALPEVLIADAEGVRKLAAPDPSGGVTIDTIGYGMGGEVKIAGHGSAGAFARLYLDNAEVATSAIAATGDWTATLAQVASGLYVLRVDQIGADGKVSSRFETPFQREAPETLAALTTAPEVTAPAPAADAATGTAATAPATATETAATAPEAETAAPAPATRTRIVTVQPGFTLWQIARESYGQGIHYVRVYDANKHLIRDPDLIYPGQVFSVPEN